MAKTIFEEMGGTHTQVGDYLLSDLILPKTETQAIGIWGQRHLRYLKKHKKRLIPRCRQAEIGTVIFPI